MVTFNKVPDKKVVKMSEHINSVVPQRTLIGEVNEHITCPLCRGYYIDATTIVECLHSFCRSCIIKHLKVKSYCPVCEMMINSAKPNIKLDKALQDIVYKLVPGLFQKEMERRQQFYASRPGPAATATPEQRGEDTERIIFSPEDVISFSLEYADVTDTDSISSKSSDSSESQSAQGITRRYLQCPAVVNISHLKKFLSMKFDIDSTQFAIDILYKRVPLPDYYTLMDIAYIYNWKRNEPMRFFYQIIDFIARRNRLFDINRKSLHLRDRKSSPASMEERSISSPALHLNDQTSEASSGTDSPMPADLGTKQINDNVSNSDVLGLEKETTKFDENKDLPSCSNNDEDAVEKSQFLNSFELTPKSNCASLKVSPNKSPTTEESTSESTPKPQLNPTKTEDKLLKRKQHTPPVTPEFKKFKAEMERAKLAASQVSNVQTPAMPTTSSSNSNLKVDIGVAKKDNDNVNKSSSPSVAQNVSKCSPPPLVPNITKSSLPPLTSNVSTVQSGSSKEVKVNQLPLAKQPVDTPSLKRPTGIPQASMLSKGKPSHETSAPLSSLPSLCQKPMTVQKHPALKLDTQPTTSNPNASDVQKSNVKKIPELKPSGYMSQSLQQKNPPVNKLRMDLLSNNCDPTIDRSKILSQVKCSPPVQPPGQTSGDPLKSLFDSCKLNIPSSLSITLTDQKLEPRPQNESATGGDTKKNIVNKNLAAASSSNFHKVPSPVHNYIEILKLPEPDTKKLNKPEVNSDTKSHLQNKSEIPATQSRPNKPSETSAKGPVPNLKPIADTKLAKQAGNYSSPITFQQTFEQQLQSLQSDKKGKATKTKAQVPKLMPATPKSLSNINKPNNNALNKPGVPSTSSVTDSKTGTALDLSTAHSMPSQLGSQQTYDKTLETMQNIANLAKKQNLPTKGLPLNMNQSPVASSLNRPAATGMAQLRIPSTSNMNPMKLDKAGPSGTQSPQSGLNRPEMPKIHQPKPANSSSSTVSSPTYHMPQHIPQNSAQPSPRQTRSPSSSPKLVIAEDKQGTANIAESSVSQPSQMSSSQLPNTSGIQKSESPKLSAGPSKLPPKPANKPMPPGKMPNMWQHMPPNLKSSAPMGSIPAEYFSRQYVPKPMDANIWFRAQRQFDILKSMSSIAQQSQNDFNKDKQ